MTIKDQIKINEPKPQEVETSLEALHNVEFLVQTAKEFITDAEKWIMEGNKSAGQRARVKLLIIRKYTPVTNRGMVRADRGVI